MAPVKLPRYVIFVGVDAKNLGHTVLPSENKDILQFSTTEENKSVSHEVISVPNSEDVVKIKCLNNRKYWRCDRDGESNWIRADKSDEPNGDKDCLFKVVQVNDKTAALQCLGNDLFLERQKGPNPADVDGLMAKASDHSGTTTHLQVTTALFNREVFDVKYEMTKLKVSKEEPETLGFKTARNDTDEPMSIEVKVPFTVTSKYSWRTVTTFNTGLDLIVTAGIPNFATKDFHDEVQRRVKNGILNPAEKLDSTYYTFKDVEPGETVVAEIKRPRVTATVPFTYKFKDQFKFGLGGDKKPRDDGVFEGEQVFGDFAIVQSSADLKFSTSSGL